MEVKSREQIIEYLKHAMELEMAVYETDGALIRISNTQISKDQLPVEQQYPVPVDKSKTLVHPELSLQPDNIFLPFLFIAGGLLCFFAYSILDGAPAIVMLFLFLFGGMGSIFLGVFSLISSIKAKKMNKERSAAYYRDLETYKKEVDEAKKQYSVELADYNEKVARDKEEFEKQTNEIKSRFLMKQNSLLSEVRDQNIKAKQTLEKLYSLNVLFPKYRYLVAVSTMYEYFASGRVSTLEGPDGAYNLYESELRQNIIIGQLNTIISQLESIKQNQYSLYQEMRKANDSLSAIQRDVNGILNNTSEIAKSSAISAMNSDIIAKNTEAIKYINLVNG